MGNSNSGAIGINLDRNPLVYYTDEILSGSVNLNITEGNLTVDEIYIKLTGEIGYTTTKTIISGNGQSSIKTEYQRASFYSIKVPFTRSQRGEKGLILNSGEYSWPFEIPLTNSLPPAISQPEHYPYVCYRLQVVIDKPWYKPNTRQTKYLTIYPRVNLLSNPQCLTLTRFGNENRKEINLKGTINKTGYVPNESINILLEFENPQKVLIKHIDLSLFQFHQIGPNTSENTLFKITLPNILNTKDSQIRETFSILIPLRLIPPTFYFHGGIDTPTTVNIHYSLRFEVKVSGLFTNFDVNIPIIIGTEPKPDLNQQTTSSSLMFPYSFDVEQSIFDDHDDDPPPTYDSVIQSSVSLI